MSGPLDFLMQPATGDQTARAGELAPAPPAPADGGQPLDFLFKPQEKRSASEIVQRGEFANREWADTAAELKKAGYAAPEEIGKQYEQRRALRTEKESQGQGVGTMEQATRHLIPFGSAIINGRRESANDEATKRFQQGIATPEDIKTIATYQRRAEADKQINSSTAGQLLSIPLAAPAVVGESLAGGKLLSLGGKALGLGKAVSPPLLAAANPSMARATLNFAGKQALLTPLMPSLYVQKANEVNAREGRSPNDIRGYAPAIGLGYAQNLVLGSLQKLGNTGSFADQIVQKGAIGVGEQALADTGISAVDEFLPKAYKTGTRYGVLGNLARGEVGEGLKQATTQMLTFSYFSALHGHTPDRTADAYREALAAQFKAGVPADPAAQAVDMPRKIVSDALARNPELTRDEAREAIDKVNKGLPRPMAAENVNYGYAIADTLPNTVPKGHSRLWLDAHEPGTYFEGRVGPGGVKPGSLLGERKATAEEGVSSLTTTPEHWMGEATPEAPGSPPEAAGEQPRPEPVKSILDGLSDDAVLKAAVQFGVVKAGSKKVTKAQRAELEKTLTDFADAAAKSQTKPPAPPEPPPASEGLADAHTIPLAKFLAGRKLEGGDFSNKVLKRVADGAPGLSSTAKEMNIGAIPVNGHEIVYRGPDGKPVAAAIVVDGKVKDFATDKTKGLLAARAAAGVGRELQKHGFTMPTGTMSPDAARVFHKHAVAEAIKQGKVVPPEVLADYPGLAAKAETPARSAGEENAPPRMEGVQLSAGRVTGEKDHQGNALTVHDLVDGDGKPIGEAKVFQSGGTLHVHWIGVNGMAGGEGRGNNPIGGRELLRLLPELAKAYPDAVVAKYTPAAGRIKAGETKWIDLQKARERGTIGAKPPEPAAAAAPEAVPSRTFTPFEKTAPDAVSSLPTRVPPPVVAERRSAPFKAKTGGDAAPEKVGGKSQRAIDAQKPGEPPPEAVNRARDVFSALERYGAEHAGLDEARILDVYRKYGPEAFESAFGIYEKKLAELQAFERGLNRDETDDEAIERELARSETDVVNLKLEIQRGKAQIARQLERSGLRREAAAREAERAIRDADEVADAAVHGGNAAKAPQPGKSRRQAGANLTPGGKVQKVIDALSDADAKANLEDVLHNFRNKGPEELGAAIGRSVEASFLSHADGHVEREVSPAALRAAVRALKSLGAVPYGPEVGEKTEYSAHYYETPARGQEVGFTERAEVARRPLVLNGAVVLRGVLRKPGTPVAKEKAVSPPGGQTLLQYIRGYGGLDASSLSPSERAEYRESGLHLIFQSDKMRKGKNAVDTLAEHLIDEGYLQADPKRNHTDVLLDALKKGRPADEGSGEAELQRHYREQEEAANDEKKQRIAHAEAMAREAAARPSDEEIPFSTEPGKEVLGGESSLTTTPKPGAFDIIAEQNKLFDVRNYVEKSVPYNKSALAVALREQEATVTSKIAAGDPLVNLEEHAHHLQKALGFPENPDGLPLVVARGAQQFYQPGGKGVPTRMGMIEGFAKWLRLRSTNGLTGLSREQEVASQFFERWAAEKGLTKTFDRIRDLYRSYQGRPAAEQAAANVSATGKPVDADRTAAEVATTVGQKFEANVVNDLSVLERMTRAARKLGHKIGIGEDPYTVYSQLMYADPARAGEFERDGVHTIVDGRKVVIGDSLAKITEGGKPEWLKPGVEGGASKAGTYAVARHVLGEEARGRTGLVSEVQLEQYRRAMEEFQKDKGFSAWADQFSDRLTKAFNATRKALAGKDVHFLSEDEVKNWEAKYPDYIPTDRVMQDAGWNALGGARGENPRKITGERSGSGEQIVDPLISYKNRLRVTSAVMGEQLKRIAVERLLKMDGMGGWGVAGEGTLTDLGKLRAETLEQFGFSGEQLRDILKSMGAERAEEYFTSRPWPTDGTKPTWGLKNADGKLVNYRIGDKALYDLITGQQVEASALASWLRATANFLPIKFMTQAVKFGATSASLGFQFRNVPRDIYTFWSNTIDRTKANPRDLGDAYKRAFAFAWHQLTGHFGGAASQDALFKKFADHRGDELRQFDFDKNNPASAYGPDRGKVVETAHTIWGVLKDTLRLAGAGELAPRFLEWKTRLQQTTGKTEAQLTSELEAAEKAAAEGRHVPDPIPFNLALDAMNHAAEVTTNFGRLGTVTREVNKITPFFGPAIAGLSKQLRNWKENPKGAAFALSGLLAARLIHWALYSDEDWYKELSANDRFNNFVVPTPAGLRRFPAPRGLEVAGGGFLTTVLDAAAKKNPDVKGYLKQSFDAVKPPLPVPPAAKVGYEIASNENWMGSPIVPKREENTSASQKFLEHQLPYAADQMTGGLLSERKVPKEAKDLLPYTEVRNARRSVDNFYERLKELEAGHQDARQQGIRFKDEAEYKRLEATGKQIAELSRAVRGEKLVNGRVVKGPEPTEDKKAEIRKRQVELARKALGQ